MSEATRPAAQAIAVLRPEPASRSVAAGVTDLLFAALALVSILPAALVRFPESVDYLDHLARLFILAAPADHPVHALYRVEWHLMPNLGLDLLGAALAPLLPVELVMKLAWMLCVLGMAAATWFLHRTLHGRSEPTLLLAVPCLLSLPLSMGFLGFVLALAAALATVGLWFRMGDRATARALLMMNVAGAAIVLLHVAAMAALAFTIVSLEALRPPWNPRAVLRRGMVAATGFLAPVVLLLLMEHAPADPSMPSFWDGIIYDPAGKLLLLLDPVFTGNGIANIAGAVALLVGLFLALRPPGGGISRRMVPAILAWALLLLILPREIGRATVIDQRLALFPTLLFLAGLHAGALPADRRRILAVLVAAAVMLRAGALILEWRIYNAEVSAFRALGNGIEPGAKVLVARVSPSSQDQCAAATGWRPFFHHLPSLLVVDRAAFVPTIFATPGMQPIRVTEPYRAISEPGGPVVAWEDLQAADTDAGRARLIAAARLNVWRQPYFLEWRRSYDYLLMLGIDCVGAMPVDDRLTPVGDSGAYRLYRIEHRG